jgi:hypothetical protein
VESDGKTYAGIVRNISPGGAQIETELKLAIGSKLSYCWEGMPWIPAEVVWREGGRMGVKNEWDMEGWDGAYPPRAVRAPANLPCRLWEGDVTQFAQITNISQTGMRCEGDLELIVNTRVTVEIGALILPNVTVRWCVDNAAGLRFEMPIRMELLETLLSDQEQPEDSNTGKPVS